MFPSEVVQALHDSHSVKWQVSTAGGKHKRKHATVTLHGFRGYLDEALLEIRRTLDGIPVDLSYKPANDMQRSYLLTFASTFNVWLKATWGIELLRTPELDSHQATAALEFGTGYRTDAHVVLRGLRRSMSHAKEYLDDLLGSLVSQTHTLMAETSFQYKEILNHTTRLRESQELMQQSCNADCTHVQPLVNTALCPPLDSRGVTFMQFPCTVTVTFTARKTHVASIDILVKELLVLAADFRYEQVQYASPAGDLIMQKLNDRAWRSEFIKQSKISGVLWDPGALTVQLWGGYRHCVEHAKQILNGLGQRPLLAIEGQSAVVDDAASSSAAEQQTVVLRWPDAVLRYVMLAEQHKQDLLSEIRKAREQCVSVTAQIPYRDKTDSLAAMLFTGWPEEVHCVVMHVQDTLRRFQDALHVCALLMTHEQLALLNADQLRVVKAVQRRFGVFVNMHADYEGEAPPRVRLGVVDARLTAHGEILTPAEAGQVLRPPRHWDDLRACALIEESAGNCMLLVEGLMEDVRQAVYELYVQVRC
jgi:hypothetical protein